MNRLEQKKSAIYCGFFLFNRKTGSEIYVCYGHRHQRTPQNFRRRIKAWERMQHPFLMGMDENVQLPVENLPAQKWDVIIVGAGPAGSVAATELAGMGHRILLADRDWFPRDKVCGDGLTPCAIRIIRRLGLYDAVSKMGRHCSQMSVFSPSHVRIDVPGDYITVRRENLDQLMARKALAAGVTFVQGTADILESQADRTAIVRFRERISGAAHRAMLSAGDRRTAVSGAKNRAGDASGCQRSSGALLYPVHVCPLIDWSLPCERGILPGYAWIFPWKRICSMSAVVGSCTARNEKHGQPSKGLSGVCR